VKGAMRLLVLGIVGLLLLGSVVAEAGSIEAQVLQFKLDHFYFNSGKEALVFPGHHFAIVRGKDTVVSGVIDESYDGVSIGSGKLPKDGKRNFEKYKAVLETAETERLSTVTIGASPFDAWMGVGGDWSAEPLSMDSSPMSNPIARRYLSGSDTLLFQYSEDTLTLFNRLEEDSVDAIIIPGHRKSRPGFKWKRSRTNLTVSLLSNPWSSVAGDGLLGTSLYSRFELERIRGSIVEGAIPENSFIAERAEQARAVPYDPEYGKKLFQRIVPRPTIVRIGIMSEYFRPIAMYFADLLAREQCRSTIVTCNSVTDCDVFLAYGYSEFWGSGITITMAEIFEYCGRRPDTDTLKMRTSSRSIFNYFNEHFDEEDTGRVYSIQVEKMLGDSLGCYSLFRPSFSLIYKENLSGLALDSIGQILVTEPRRLRLPSTSTGGDR
jgi:hypothetical protein